MLRVRFVFHDDSKYAQPTAKQMMHFCTRMLQFPPHWVRLPISSMYGQSVHRTQSAAAQDGCSVMLPAATSDDNLPFPPGPAEKVAELRVYSNDRWWRPLGTPAAALVDSRILDVSVHVLLSN
jgi:hypothetical protein